MRRRNKRSQVCARQIIKKEIIGDQEDPTEVTKVTKASNMKPEVAHAPDEEELNAVAHAPAELLEINGALQHEPTDEPK